ncbi:MAG: hypothetical protein H7Y32_11255 [Chloroflexales bacterium]|nr:hypothetical protein [Chloroflexales bacterium]
MRRPWNGFVGFLGTGIVLTLLVVVVFVVLQWLRVPSGQLLDWLVGIASCWWLLVVVTVPWNIHFQAREVVYDAARSHERQIALSAEQVAYARGWIGRSLAIAVALHLLSALALYALAVAGISPVGYITAFAALLLTALRPLARAYAYVADRLSAIGHEVRYPRDDVVKLLGDVRAIQERLERIEAAINVDAPQSWAAQLRDALAELRAHASTTRATLDDLRATNQLDHQRLAREAQGAIAQLSADSQFLGQVREIIRFVKEA